MTEPSDRDDNTAAAIRAIRHDILSNRRDMSWEDIRQWIRGLVRHARPSPDERIQLLELYDRAAATVQRRLLADPEGSRRLRYQRANDTLLFMLSELRDEAATNRKTTLAAIVCREYEAGRMHMDGSLGNLISWVLQESDHRPAPMSPGVCEDDAGVAYQPPVSPPLSSPSFPPGP
jgi:hypothetical protein